MSTGPKPLGVMVATGFSFASVRTSDMQAA